MLTAILTEIYDYFCLSYINLLEVSTITMPIINVISLHTTIIILLDEQISSKDRSVILINHLNNLT